ncbi:MAG: gliding motility-associated C-terminal domain-containing protein [Bacteroidia bacterium]|nr:gliding motility-associated C-terminal domain-containing protein [Bacteroidia bacterium]MDW8016134.1 gliding motility-associated C-terminal domain-containing protein [Bacteroidia bacterium]
MKRVLGLLGFGLAQMLSNWGEVIRVEPGGIVSVIGSVTNRQGGGWYHSGALYITDTIDNQAGNEMFIPTLPNGTPITPGKVQLWGGYQWITGTDPIHFDTLELRGSSSKNLARSAYVRHWLDLEDRMLNTHSETLYHRSSSTHSITRVSGFIRSGLGGALERTCIGGERYLFPLGDSLPVVRYRPVYITPNADGRYAGRLAAIDATIEGYDRSQLDSSLCLINPHYFHHLSGPQGGFLELSFDPAQDGDYDAAAHWRGAQWDSIGGALSSSGGLSWMNQPVGSFTPTPFALAVRQPRVRIIPEGPHELCPGDSVQLSIANPDPAWNYTWSHGPQDVSVWITQGGIYTVTVSNAAGCIGVSNAVEVRILPPPSAEIVPVSPQSICPGDSIRLVASSGEGYQWFYEGLPLLGATDSVLVVREPGRYWVQVVQRCGTAESEPFVLELHPTPSAYFLMNPSDSAIVGTSVSFRDSSQGGVSLQWFINGAPITSSSFWTFTFLQEGTFVITLVAQNEFGCQDTFTRVIHIYQPQVEPPPPPEPEEPEIPRGIFIPTAFTPNGDGQNDIFLIVTPPLEWSRLRIYSRWGLLVRETTDQPPRWDGKDSGGSLVPEDSYTFVFEARLLNGQYIQRTGTVTVLR